MVNNNGWVVHYRYVYTGALLKLSGGALVGTTFSDQEKW